MKRFFYATSSMLLVIFLSGCIQDDIVIHIKPDGSGAIEETSLLSNNMIAVMESLAGGMTDSGKQKSDQDNKDAAKANPQKDEKKIHDEIMAKLVKDAEDRAETFGAGVKFKSAKAVKTETGSGYTAVYTFQDINLVKVNQNPSDKVDLERADKGGSAKEEPLMFKFAKGSPSRLVISFPAKKDAAGDKTSAPDDAKTGEDKSKKESDTHSAEMAKKLFQDMKLKILLQIEGTIINTNATFRDGSTITLLEMDFGKVMNNSALFKQLGASRPQSIEETKALFKGVEGLKFETNNPVTVEFK
ncbi:MAG TPA: hypothetical protein VMT12_17045 [Syntrophales bacterium]|nr:hypothetical protein [Syntrophales bacterium]